MRERVEKSYCQDVIIFGKILFHLINFKTVLNVFFFKLLNDKIKLFGEPLTKIGEFTKSFNNKINAILHGVCTFSNDIH